MSTVKHLIPDSHVVDILGSTKGRDQPIMLMEKAMNLVSCFDDSIFSDDSVVFLDPFCKAGEILLATAMKACLISTKRNPKLTTDSEIYQELYRGNYFAIAPDERHYLLSKRTFYGNNNSHNNDLTKHIVCGNYVSDIDGKLNVEKFKKELNHMIEHIIRTKPNARIIAIGNPPYQEADGGFGKSAKPVYHIFVEALAGNDKVNQFALVIPSRWFAGGKGLDGFRNNVLTSGKVKSIYYFKNASEVFPTVDINGGVCFLHWDKEFNGRTHFTDGQVSNDIHINTYDIIPDDPMSYSIIEKVKSIWSTGTWLSDMAWASKPFGLRTFYFNEFAGLSASDPRAVPCISIGKETKFANKRDITRNADKIDLWKVCVPKAAGGSKGNRRSTVPLNAVFLVPKGTITTETYNVLQTFEKKSEGENLITYLRTDFARYMVGLRKITQDLPKDRWDWVPLMDVSKHWTDEKLFDFFGLTKQERDHIKKKVKEWS